MSITTTRLTRGAGLSAVAAGLLFIVIQLVHPHEDVAAVTTTAWIVVALLTMAMSVLLLVGLTGMYLRQVTETGLPGLVGFLLFGSTFVLTIAVTFVEVFVLPRLADQAPQYVDDFLATFTGGAVVGDVGSLQLASLVAAVGYLLGVCCSVSFCTELGSSRAGPPCCWPSAPSPRSSFPSSPTPSTGSSPFPSDWLWPVSDTRCGASRPGPHSSPRPAFMLRVATRLVSSDAARRRRGAADSAAASGVDLAAARRAGRAQPDPGAGRVCPTRRARGRTGTVAASVRPLPRAAGRAPRQRHHLRRPGRLSVPGRRAAALGPRGTTPQAASSWSSAWSWRSPRCG